MRPNPFFSLSIDERTALGAGRPGEHTKLYAMVSIVTALILHQYLLHAHMNGRMLDVWRRLNADEDNFFIPHDLELSAAELQHACIRASKWRGPNGARREVVFHDFHANDDEDHAQPAEASPRNQSSGSGGGRTRLSEGTAGGGRGRGAFHRTVSSSGDRDGRDKSGGRGATTTHVVIYDVSVDAKKSLHRQFLRASDGTILEIFGEAGQEVGWQLTSSLNALMREEMGGKESNKVQKDQGIFAGMLPTVAPVASSASALDKGDEASKGDEANTIDA